jgi:hypothetical protein
VSRGNDGTSPAPRGEVPEAAAGIVDELDVLAFLAEAVAIENELDPIAKGIARVKSLPIGQRIVPFNRKCGLLEALPQQVEIRGAKSWMRLSLRREILLDAKMQNDAAQTKPTAAAAREWARLRFLPHTDDAAEKSARFLLSSHGHGQLKMV